MLNLKGFDLMGGSNANLPATTARNALNWGIGLAKIRGIYYTATRLATTVKKIVDYGSDFEETLNMWQVAMRNSLDMADTFVKRMHTAYGISTQTLMENQAIYKNMLSQMGDLSEETSYALSESLSQMVLDYASLWNTTIQSASEKFKAMLAGQIRPIRSISGISVEEKAIFDIYQQMGGTKTMRQLTQVEKRLLRIYATYYQMTQSGAVGDFSKTLNNYANQSRLMSEYWKELVTYLGIGVKELIVSSGIMTKINALLIVATEIVKALVNYKTPDFLAGMVDETEEVNNAIDEIQGKLLDFDKFRTLEDSKNGGLLQIDQTILNAMTGYSSVISGVKNDSQILADTWLELLGFSKDVNGEWTASEKTLGDIKSSLSAIVGAVVTLVGLGLISSIGNLIVKLKALKFHIGGLNTLLITGFVGAMVYAVKALDEGRIGAGLLATVISGTLLVALVRTNKVGILQLVKTIKTKLLSAFAGAVLSTGSLAGALTMLTGSILGIGGALVSVGLLFANWDVMTDGQRAIGVIGALTSAILGLSMAMGVFKSTLSLGLATAGIVAGITAVVASVTAAQNKAKNIGKFANGGYPDRGTLFYAGEKGAELVTTQSNGQSAVMNMQQLQAAVTRGMISALSATKSRDSNEPTIIKIGEEEVFTVVRRAAKKRGYNFK